jgi:hypothetical protein
MAKPSSSKYKSLIISATSPETDIWLADDEGFLVQKETGTLDTSILPGRYFVQFGDAKLGYWIDLQQELVLTEEDLCRSQTPSKPNVPKL